MALRLSPCVDASLESASVLALQNVLPFRRPDADGRRGGRIHLSPPELAGGEMEALE